MYGRCIDWRRPGRLPPAETGANPRRRNPWQVSRRESETSPTPMNNAYERLRALMAQGERAGDYRAHMEGLATVAEARSTALALVHEGNEWRRAGPG